MLIGVDASRANNIEKTGVEWYSYHIIRAMMKKDRKNRYFLYSREPLQGGLEDRPGNWESRVLKWPFRLWTQLRLSWEMLINSPDILFISAHAIPFIHPHGPKRTITTLHDIGFERFPELYSPAERAYHRWAVKFALKHVDTAITVSQFSKDEMIRAYGADPEKIKVVHLAYDHESYRVIMDQRAINNVLHKYNIDRPYLLYVGRLEKKKNTLRLIKAFARLNDKDMKLVLVGKKGFGSEKAEAYIEKEGLKDRVIMPGWVEQDDLPYLLNGARAFIFPSLYEGFGMPILEAMACGCPVLCSNTTALPEVAGDAALLINPCDKKELARGMEMIIEDIELRNMLINRGLQRAKDFSWEKCAEETMKILEKGREGCLL